MQEIEHHFDHALGYERGHELEINHIAPIKARARRAHPQRNLDYLRERIQLELEQRWRSDVGDDKPQRVLLLDFEDSKLHLGKAVSIEHASLINHSTIPNSGDFAGVIIGMQMAWLDMPALLTQTLQALRAGGRLLFCTFGPDTLQQVRKAWWEVDDAPHVHPFIDMHHIGDQLLRCGFTRPIVDVDRITIEYENLDTLYADLRGEGFTNILSTRRKTLTGKGRFNAFTNAVNGLRPAGAAMGITCELIYGSAYAPLPSSIRVTPPSMASSTS